MSYYYNIIIQQYLLSFREDHPLSMSECVAMMKMYLWLEKPFYTKHKPQVKNQIGKTWQDV